MSAIGNYLKALKSEILLGEKRVTSDSTPGVSSSIFNSPLLATWLDAFPIAVWIIQKEDLRYTYANKMALSIMGIHNLIGQKISDVLGEVSANHQIELLEYARQTGHAVGADEVPIFMPGINSEEKEAYFNFSYQPMADERNQILGFMITGVDVTDKVLARRHFRDRMQLETELAEAKMSADKAQRAKNVFLANIGHEIRSPLSAIMGFSNLLKQGQFGRRGALSLASSIDKNSAHLMSIIDDILEISKAESGPVFVENRKFALNPLLSHIFVMLRMKAQEKGLNLYVHVPGQMPSEIISDPDRIQQLLLYVVGNAIKFTERGQINLCIRYENSLLEFEVHDTGCGIPEDQQAGLFMSFHQADGSYTRSAGGTGLGLALTRKIVKAMNGHFYLKRSVVNEGSTFVVAVQAESAENAVMIGSSAMDFAVAEKNEKKMTKNSLEGMSVLIVDDSEDNQDLFKIILEHAGAKVEVANDGIEGVEYAMSNDYDVILMDVQMPRMDGHKATQTLRINNYRKPILALTAHSLKEEKVRALESGFNEFLTKPIGGEALVSMVAQYHH